MPTDTDDALAGLVRRSEAGDVRALAELRKELPGLVPWADLEALARRAREAWAAVHPVRRDERLRALNEESARLVRPGAGPLERLLAGRVALARARLSDLRNWARGDEPAPPAAARDIARRVKRAERDAAAAERTLRAFQQRMSPGP